MKCDFTFLSFNSFSKDGKSFNILHYFFKNEKGALIANTEFLSDPIVIDQVKDLTPLKTYVADIRYINKKNVLINLL